MNRKIQFLGLGYSLIELMVVLVILSLLAARAMISYTSSSVRTKTAEAFMLMGQCQRAVEQYAENNGSLPTTATLATQSVCNATSPGKYVAQISYTGSGATPPANYLGAVISVKFNTDTSLADASGTTYAIAIDKTPFNASGTLNWGCLSLTTGGISGTQTPSTYTNSFFSSCW